MIGYVMVSVEPGDGRGFFDWAQLQGFFRCAVSGLREGQCGQGALTATFQQDWGESERLVGKRLLTNGGSVL